MLVGRVHIMSRYGVFENMTIPNPTYLLIVLNFLNSNTTY